MIDNSAQVFRYIRIMSIGDKYNEKLNILYAPMSHVILSESKEYKNIKLHIFKEQKEYFESLLVNNMDVLINDCVIDPETMKSKVIKTVLYKGNIEIIDEKVHFVNGEVFSSDLISEFGQDSHEVYTSFGNINCELVNNMGDEINGSV